MRTRAHLGAWRDRSTRESRIPAIPSRGGRRACLLLILALLWPAGAAAEPPSLDHLRTRARTLVNEDRERHGLAPMKSDEALSEAAQRHAEDMLSRGYFAHESPEGETALGRFVAAGGDRWRKVAENVGRCVECGSAPTLGDVQRFQEGWMNSAEHRANILDPGLDSFGFGIAARDGRQYAVQTFAGPGLSPAPESGRDGETLPADERDDVALALINRMRSLEEVPPLKSSAALTKAAGTLLEPLARAAGPTDLQVGGDALYAALPEANRQRWRELTVLAGACGGCGSRPTEGDLRFFTQQWMETPQHRALILDPDFTDLGFALAADGQGRKTALAVLGRRN